CSREYWPFWTGFSRSYGLDSW
nr:immunoglobulin heavy chain junction region [Macaca mulatta]